MAGLLSASEPTSFFFFFFLEILGKTSRYSVTSRWPRLRFVLAGSLVIRSLYVRACVCVSVCALREIKCVNGSASLQVGRD